MNFSDLYEGPSCCSAVVTGLREKTTEKKKAKKKKGWFDVSTREHSVVMTQALVSHFPVRP